MDIILEGFDTLCFDRLYARLLPASLAYGGNGTDAVLSPKVVSALNWCSSNSDVYGKTTPLVFPASKWAEGSILLRNSVLRQYLSLFVVTTIFGWILYFSTAWLSFHYVYDKENLKHPKFLRNQIKLEIEQATSAIPVMTALTVPWFVLETQGYGKMYWKWDEYGKLYFFLQFPLFLVFTDCFIYMIHRGLHHKLIYKHLHKPHHKWIVPTPFASHAFHPIDGYSQSLPYHVFAFIFPLQKIAYVLLFMVVNIWTVMIHDGEYLANDPVINGSACHTIHHLYFNYNYGQYTTLWDRLGGTHRTPDQELFDKSARKDKKTIEKQIHLMEEIQHEVEGNDTRAYVSGSAVPAKR